jgi:hypothetical protein
LVHCDKDKLLGLVNSELANNTPATDILNQGLIAGMDIVSEKMENGDMFIPEVLMSARAMEECVAILKPLLGDGESGNGNNVITGTVKGDKIMGKDILFMLNPWYDDDQGPFYCPDCGVVEGFFTYSPEVKDQIQIVCVDYERPRKDIIEYLGNENQGSPVLVLDDEAKFPKGAKESITTGKTFIDDSVLICNYLGETFNAVRPHP